MARPQGRAFEVEPLLSAAAAVAVAEEEEEGSSSLWRSALDGPYLRLLPHVHGTDGAFACRLRRREA